MKRQREPKCMKLGAWTNSHHRRFGFTVQNYTVAWGTLCQKIREQFPQRADLSIQSTAINKTLIRLCKFMVDIVIIEHLHPDFKDVDFGSAELVAAREQAFTDDTSPLAEKAAWYTQSVPSIELPDAMHFVRNWTTFPSQLRAKRTHDYFFTPNQKMHMTNLIASIMDVYIPELLDVFTTQYKMPRAQAEITDLRNMLQVMKTLLEAYPLQHLDE